MSSCALGRKIEQPCGNEVVMSMNVSKCDIVRELARSCVRGGAAGDEGKGLHQRVVGMEQPAQGSGHGLECWSSGSVWAALSDTGFGFWVVLCGIKGWT